MKLAIYSATIPPTAADQPFKLGGIRAFAEGAKRHGVSIIETDEENYVKSDVGLMFSFVDLTANKSTLIPYMKTRRRIYLNSNKKLFFFENDVLKDLNQQGEAVTQVGRFPFGSVYDDEAEYFLGNIPDERVDTAFQHIQPKQDKKVDKRPIVLNLNRMSGYGRCGVDQFKWAYKMLEHLYSLNLKTKIRLRVHPGDIKQFKLKVRRPIDIKYSEKIQQEFPQVILIQPAKGSYLKDVNYASHNIFSSSSASCESIVCGKKTIVTHPSAFAFNYCPNAFLEDKECDANGLLKKYKKTHFTLDEIRSGVYWDYIKEGLKDLTW